MTQRTFFAVYPIRRKSFALKIFDILEGTGLHATGGRRLKGRYALHINGECSDSVYDAVKIKLQVLHSTIDVVTELPQ